MYEPTRRSSDGRGRRPGNALTRFLARDSRGVLIDRLCFGVPAGNALPEPGVAPPAGAERTKELMFVPGQVFCPVWWRRDPDGTQHRALAVLEALPPSKRRTGRAFELRGVSPAVVVHAMVDQHGPAGTDGAVDRFVDLVDGLRRKGADPTKVRPAYWRGAALKIMERSDPPRLDARHYRGKLNPDYPSKQVPPGEEDQTWRRPRQL